ncbi:ribonuclease PH, partial [Methylobacterium radiotolerans]
CRRAEEGPITHDEYTTLLTTGVTAVQGVMGQLARELAVIQGM